MRCLGWHMIWTWFAFFSAFLSVEACEPWACDGLHNTCSTACKNGRWLDLSGLVARIEPSYNKARVKGLNAIDGNLKTCTESKNSGNWPAWSLNLGRRYQVAAIRVTSKSQPALDYYNTPDRIKLSGFSAGLRNNHGQHIRCAINVAIGNGETRTVKCIAKGTYLEIRKRVGKVRLCEVSVFVVPLDLTHADIESCVFRKSATRAIEAPDSPQFSGLARHYVKFSLTAVELLHDWPACKCELGWTGARCSQREDVCAALTPCRSNQVCTNDIGSPKGHTCTCIEGWTGDKCESCSGAKCYTCFSQNNALGTHPLKDKCYRQLPDNGKHSVPLQPACTLALDSPRLRKAKANSPKNPTPKYTDVLVVTATYYFDDRMHNDYARYSREFKALSANNKNHRFHFAVAYTGMLDHPPKPLRKSNGRRHLRQWMCKKCADPPPSTDIRIIQHHHLPPGEFYHARVAWMHSHFTIPVAMKNIFKEQDNRTFSHVWIIDPDIGILGNMAKFIEHQMETRGETVLATHATAHSLEESYRFYTVPSVVKIGSWQRWGECTGFNVSDRRGIVPMLVRMSDDLLQEFTINFHRPCFVEGFIPNVCVTMDKRTLADPKAEHRPCTIGTIAREFHGYMCACGPVFHADGPGATRMKTMSLDWRYNQSRLYHPFKIHEDWHSVKVATPSKSWSGGADYWGPFDKVKDAWTTEGVLFWSPTTGDTGTKRLRQTHICERLE